MDKTPESSAGLGIIASEIVKTSEDCRKRHTVDLRPAPLFRALGLTGLSASLPPHRRLRSVLNTTRSTLGQSVDRPDPLMDRPHRNSPLNGLICIQDKPLPKILHATHQKDEISMNKEPPVVGVQRWHHGQRTARTRGRDTGIRPEKEEYLFEEVWREQTPKVMRKKKNKQVKNEASDFSLWIQSLEITDSERKQATKRHRSNSSGRGNWAESLCKGAGQTQRDRRPHFLPPITQSDCLLNVPLLLPDNSPPPSPCSPSEILLFPLSVPHIQPFPRERRGDAAAQRD
ncbi:uncharacterized protein LOC107752754 [Sinocyclocheilus rhinocerous]|uniref:uncharacterized protein LOC107752754 n=1 Tax=Sinocyclocheilus rhinocerous TaxID=307959 RepID=UPI0007BACA0E|nr:PREDICTED: uncharacterized protein LOC107752754 [Sinocyclocheilus rhinocerous]